MRYDVPALTVGRSTLSLGQALCFAARSGLLDDAVSEVVGLLRAADGAAEADEERVRRELERWRRELKMGSGDATRGWLRERGAELGDVLEHLALRVRADGSDRRAQDAAATPRGPSVWAALGPYLLCTRAMEPVLERVALALLSADRYEGEIADGPVELSLSPIELPLTDDEAATRALVSRYAAATADFLTDEALGQELARCQAEMTVVVVLQVETATRSAALELLAQAREGVHLAVVAAELGLPGRERRVTREALPPTAFGAQIASALPGEAVGPEAVTGGGYQVTQVLARIVPSALEPPVRPRLVHQLLRRRFAARLADEARIHHGEGATDPTPATDPIAPAK